MRFFLLFMLMYPMFTLHSQKRLNGYVELAQNADYGLKSPNEGLMVTESSLNFGVNYDVIDGSITFYGTYAYGGVVNYNSFEYFHKDFSAYQLDYHLLGGGIKFKFRDKDKFYSPTLKITFLTEITSKYRGKKLISDGNHALFDPTNHHYPIFDENYSPPKVIGHSALDYISTPLVGSFLFGNEFKVYNNLFINVEVGYLFRIFRYKRKKWLLGEKEPVTEITQTHSLKDTSKGINEFKGCLDFSLGINYTFPFKQKTKPK